MEKVTRGGKKLAASKSVAKAKGGGENLKESTDTDNPQLQEFLQVMQPQTKSKLWANDTLAVLDCVNRKQEIEENESRDISVPVHAELVQSGSSDDRSSNNHKSKKSNGLVLDDVISDIEYFKSRVTKNWFDSESSDNDEDNNKAFMSNDDDDKDNDSHGNDGKENCDNKSSKVDGRRCAQNFDPSSHEYISGEDEDHEKAEVNNHSNYSGDKVPDQGVRSSCLEEKKGVSDSCRLFVHSLPYTAIEKELEEHFSKFGNVSEVHLVVHKDTKQSKGRACIRYTLPEFAARNNSSKDQISKTLKQQREEERKAAEASGDTRAWNSLFMHSDTVFNTWNATLKA